MSISENYSNGLAHQIELRRHRQLKLAIIWGGVLLFSAWCLNGTIIEDTDWSRIGGRNGVFASISRYLTIDLSLFSELIVPTIETFMMATVGTVLGCFFIASGMVGSGQCNP